MPDDPSADSNPGEVGIHYITEDKAPSGISREQAIQVAKDHVGYMAEQASGISARHVLLSDDQRFTEEPSGQKHYLVQNVPAWIVTFEGVALNGRGHIRRSDGHVGSPRPNHDVSVAVNSVTGAYIMLYTYR